LDPYSNFCRVPFTD